MAFEIIMLMAAVTGECGCIQLIPCNLFFASLFLPPLLLSSVLGKIESFPVFNLVARSGRLGRWSLGLMRFFSEALW